MQLIIIISNNNIGVIIITIIMYRGVPEISLRTCFYMNVRYHLFNPKSFTMYLLSV